MDAPAPKPSNRHPQSSPRANRSESERSGACSFLRLHGGGYRSRRNAQRVNEAGEEIECGRRGQQFDDLLIVVRALQLRVKRIVELVRRTVHAVCSPETKLLIFCVGPMLEIMQALDLRVTGTFLFRR